MATQRNSLDGGVCAQGYRGSYLGGGASKWAVGPQQERRPSLRRRMLVEPGGWLHKGDALKKKTINVLRIIEFRSITVRERSHNVGEENYSDLCLLDWNWRFCILL